MRVRESLRHARGERTGAHELVPPGPTAARAVGRRGSARAGRTAAARLVARARARADARPATPEGRSGSLRGRGLRVRCRPCRARTAARAARWHGGDARRELAGRAARRSAARSRRAHAAARSRACRALQRRSGTRSTFSYSISVSVSGGPALSRGTLTPAATSPRPSSRASARTMDGWRCAAWRVPLARHRAGRRPRENARKRRSRPRQGPRPSAADRSPRSRSPNER